MQTTHVTDNLTQLKRMRFVNAYLVREDDGFTLIDTTLGGGADKLIAAAGGELRRVVMTHGHGDHIGSAAAIKEQLGDRVELMIPELDVKALAGELGKLPGSWPKNFTTKPDTTINGGDRIGSLEVIASPGHTPGHVSFLDTRDNSLIAGDAFTAYGGVAIPAHFYLRFPLAFPATWDRPKAVESAVALRALNPSLLVVGHGPAIKDPGGAMDAAIARAQKALK